MRLLLIISFILCSLFSFSQTEGSIQTVGIASADSIYYFAATGWGAAPTNRKILIYHWPGIGATSRSATLGEAPMKKFVDGWNGKFLQGTDTIYVAVVTTRYDWANASVGQHFVRHTNWIWTNFTMDTTAMVAQLRVSFTGYSGGGGEMSKPLTGAVFDGSDPSYAITRFKKIGTAATGYWQNPNLIKTVNGRLLYFGWVSSNDPTVGATPTYQVHDSLALNPGSTAYSNKLRILNAGYSHGSTDDTTFSYLGDSADNNIYRWIHDTAYNTSATGGGGGGGGGGTISTNKVRANTRMVKNMRLIYGKDLFKLFDGDATTDMTVTDEDPGAQGIPDEQWIVFDSVYNHTQFRYYDTSGTATVNVTVYNKNLDSLYSYDLNTSGFRAWHTDTTGFNSKDSIWAIRFIFPAYLSYINAITEFEFYGDAQGVAPNIWRTSLRTYNDPGKYGFGIGQLDDRDMNYVHLVGNSMRLIYANVRSNNADDSALALNQFGFRSDNGGVTNKLNVEALNAAQSYGMHVTLTPTGGSIKNLASGTIKPYDYTTWTAIFTNKKYITPGADSTQYSAWTGLGHNAAMWAYLYGNSTSATRSYNFYGGNSTQGQNKIANLSNYNEWSKTWNGAEGHHDAYVYYASQKVFYDSVKAIDPNLPVYMGALIMMEDFFPIAFNWVHYLKTRNATDFPADGWDFNTYLNSKYAGQFFDGADSAITPERWRVYDRLISTRNINDSAYGRLRIQWTENGFDTAAASPFRVTTLPGKSKQEVKADLTARTYAIAQAVPYGVEALYYYWFETDFTYIFGGMAAALAHYDGGGAYVNTTFYPVGNLLWQQKDIEELYPWWSTVVTNGDSTGVWVTRKTHNTLNKKIYKVWKGTYNGSTSSHTIDFGSGVTSVNKISWDYNSGVPTTTPVTLSGNSYTDTITEKLVWYEATYGEVGGRTGLPIRKGKRHTWINN